MSDRRNGIEGDASGLDKDITGPNKSSKIEIKPDAPDGGKRLSKAAKLILFGGAAGIGVLVVAGVMMSGRHGTGSAGAGANPDSGQIGMTPPPAPPPVLASAPLPNASPAPATPTKHQPAPSSRPLVLSDQKPAASAKSQKKPSLGSEAPGASLSGTGGEQSAAAQFRKWKERQRYHFYESQIKNDYAAYSAPLSAGGGSLLQGATAGLPGGSADQTMQRLANTQMALLGKIGSQRSGSPLSRAAKSGFGTGFGGGQSTGRYGQSGRGGGFGQQGSGSGYLDAKLRNPRSSHEIFAGSIIPAVLVTGIDSDLPGQITAQVRQNVYNSLDPSQVLIPQGARLIGVYDSGVAYGQSRVMVAWTRLILPNGQTLALGGMNGVDEAGLSGFHDLVNNHYWRIFGSAFLISLLGAGAQLSQPQTNNTNSTPTASQQAIAALAQEWNNVGSQLLQKNLNIKPTLIIQPGYEFNVFVRKTISMPVWHAAN